MKVKLNGQIVDTQCRTLDGLLNEQGYDSLVVATAVNGLFVAVVDRGTTQLKESCEVEIVAPMQGG